MEEVGADKQGCHAALSSSPFYKTEGATAITTASNSTTPHVQYDESTTLLPPYHPNPPSCSSGLPLDDDPAQKELKRQPQPQHQASTHINHNDDHCGPPRFSRDALIQKITSLYSNGKKRQYSHDSDNKEVSSFSFSSILNASDERSFSFSEIENKFFEGTSDTATKFDQMIRDQFHGFHSNPDNRISSSTSFLDGQSTYMDSIRTNSSTSLNYADLESLVDSHFDGRLSSDSPAWKVPDLEALAETAVAMQKNSLPLGGGTMDLKSQNIPVGILTTADAAATATAAESIVESSESVEDIHLKAQGIILPPSMELLCAASDTAMKLLNASKEQQEQKAAILALAAAIKSNDRNGKSNTKKKRRRANDDSANREQKQRSKRILKDSETAPSEQSSDAKVAPVKTTTTTNALGQGQEPNLRQHDTNVTSSLRNSHHLETANGNENSSESVKSSILALAENCKREQAEIKARKKLDGQTKKPRIIREPENKQYFDKAPEDIIFGRGTGSTQHNKNFRKNQVAPRYTAYRDGNDSEKTAIVRELVDWVKSQKGRFLHKDAIGWYEVTEEAALLKVRTMVREYAPSVEDEQEEGPV